MTTLNELLEQSKSELKGALDNKIKSWNAKIINTFLGYEDHGTFTFYLCLENESNGQYAGGYALDNINKDERERHGTANGMQLIMDILKVVGVDSWEKLEGRYVRVHSSHCKVHAIQNITDDTKFIHFTNFFEDHKNVD